MRQLYNTVPLMGNDYQLSYIAISGNCARVSIFINDGHPEALGNKASRVIS
jgi:hypothetical protein